MSEGGDCEFLEIGEARFYLSDEDSDWDNIEDKLNIEDGEKINCRFLPRICDTVDYSEDLFKSSSQNHKELPFSSYTSTPKPNSNNFDKNNNETCPSPTQMFSLNKNLSENCLNVSQKYANFDTEAIYQSEKFITSFSETFDIDAEESLSFNNGALSPHSIPLSQQRKIEDIKNISSLMEEKISKEDDLSLSDCGTKLFQLAVIAVVVSICPIKEIWSKKYKYWLPMTKIILSDYTGNYAHLNLWKEQCKYALSLHHGDIVFIQEVKGGEINFTSTLQLIQRSKISVLSSKYNHDKFLSVFDKLNRTEAMNTLHQSVANNINWFKSTNEPLLNETINKIFPRNPDIKFEEFEDLQSGNKVHVRGMISSVGDQKEHERPSVVCILISTSTYELQHINLYLHGSCKPWLKNLLKLPHNTWEFTYLDCCTSDETDRVELHTTVVSTCQCLHPEDDKSICDTSDMNEPITVVRHFNELINLAELGSPINLILQDISITCITFQGRSLHRNDKNFKHWLDYFHTSCHGTFDTIHLKFTFEGDSNSIEMNMGPQDLIQYIKDENLANLSEIFQENNSVEVEFHVEKDSNGIIVNPSLHFISFNKENKQ